MGTMPAEPLDADACYRAIAARDARFDGRFFTAVSTTGIYCRPTCPARTPLRRNVAFYRHAAVAEAAGFRPCRRCHPGASPDSPDWNQRADLVGRALRLIDEGAADAGGVAAVADRLGVSARHLHRLFLAELGVGPQAVARSRRVQRAHHLVRHSTLPLTEVAFAAGFGSIRQFNAAYLDVHGRSPSSVRAGWPTAARGGAVLETRLAYRPPLDGPGLLAFLAKRAIPGVEVVGEGSYRRTFRFGADGGTVELVPVADRPEVVLRVHPADGSAGPFRSLARLVVRARRLLDLDADPGAVADVLAADPALGPLVAARPGLRVPGAFDGFELAVRAVLGQQVSVAAARTLAGRLVTLAGTPLPGAAGATGGETALLFPTAAEVAEADLTLLGMPDSRRRTLRGLAEAVARGFVDLDGSADIDDTCARLLSLPGIGPWTVAYVRLRALRDPDSFLVGDLALRKAAVAIGLPEPWPELVARAEAWRPWRGYASFHLWATLPDVSPRPTRPPGPARPGRR